MPHARRTRRRRVRRLGAGCSLLLVALTLGGAAVAVAVTRAPRWLPSRQISPGPLSRYTCGGALPAMNARGDTAVSFGCEDKARGTGGSEVVLRPATGRFTAPVSLDAPVADVAIGDGGQVLGVGTRGDAISPAPERVVAVAGSTGTRSFGAPVTIGSPMSSDSDHSPRVAMNGHGDGVVAWVRQNPHGEGILASIRRAGGRFGAPETIPGSSGRDPQVGMDARGDVTVAWLTRAGAVLALDVAVRPAGGRFGAPTTVSRSTQDLAALDLAVSPTGEAVLASLYGDGSIAVVLRGRDGGFGPPHTLAGPSNNYLVPVAAIDARGEAVVAWGRPYKSDVLAAVRRPGHGFGPATILSRPGEPAGEPVLAGGGTGHFTVAWATRTKSGLSYVVARVKSAGKPFGAERRVTRFHGGGEGFAFGVTVDALGDALAVTGADGRVQAADYDPGRRSAR